MRQGNSAPTLGDGYNVAIAIIRYRDNVLLTKRHDPESRWHEYWEFPGGTVEPQETIETALRREIDEETGIQIDQRQCTFLKTYALSDAESSQNIYLHLYSIELSTKPVIQLDSEESSAYEWVQVREAADYPGLLPQNVEMIDDYIRGGF